MSIETGVVVALDGSALHWHLPPGRHVALLPDSRDLWDIFWTNRDNILGFAHSHPGSGMRAAMPSWEDVTTFDAIEKALGKRLRWWITSNDVVLLHLKVSAERYSYEPSFDSPKHTWLAKLRELSNYNNANVKESTP